MLLKMGKIIGRNMSVPPLPDYRPATSWVHYTTSCKYRLVLLKMGEIIGRNMSS
jgi:hypothetical protein